MIHTFTNAETGEILYYYETIASRGRGTIKNKISQILNDYCDYQRGRLSFKTLQKILQYKHSIHCVLSNNSQTINISEAKNMIVLLELLKRRGNCRRILTSLEYTGWIDKNNNPTEKWSTLDQQSDMRFQWEDLINKVNTEITEKTREGSRSGMRIGRKSIEIIGDIIEEIEKPQD